MLNERADRLPEIRSVGGDSVSRSAPEHGIGLF
jgi:hypothetical protein